jgi:hypothetical protein
MAKKQYTYRDGSRYSVPAEVVGTELERIRRAHGLSASVLIEEATPEDAPLHPIFEWDDEAAGAQYRLLQARKLIRAVQVVQADGSARSVYVHVTGAEREGDYDNIETVVQHIDRYTLALLELEKKLSAASEAVEELKAAASVTGDPDKMARISIAIEAMRTAGEAVRALH